MDAVPIVPLFGQPKTRHFTSYKQATHHALLTDGSACRILSAECPYNARQQYRDRARNRIMQQPPAAEFGIAEAKRVLGEVFAHGCRTQSVDRAIRLHRPAVQPTGSRAHPLRLPFSERLCRNAASLAGQG